MTWVDTIIDRKRISSFLRARELPNMVRLVVGEFHDVKDSSVCCSDFLVFHCCFCFCSIRWKLAITSNATIPITAIRNKKATLVLAPFQ